MCIRNTLVLGGGFLVTLMHFGASADAQNRPEISTNLFGVPGLINMPSGEPVEDGEISIHALRSPRALRSGFQFQLTPRISGGFRYAIIDGFDGLTTKGERYDRSFDVAYQIAYESKYLPAVKVGLQDFGGTGIYSAEYVAATKSFLENRVKATAGIGWGRFATHGEFSNPLGIISDRFKDRDTVTFGVETAGELNPGQWFQGDAALFGGVSWQATDQLKLKLEYSSDAASAEESRNVLNFTSPVNFGAEYQFKNGANLGLYYVFGTEFTLRFATSLNPKRPLSSAIEEAPPPVFVRNNTAAARNLFGRVIDGTKRGARYGGTLPEMRLTRSPTGIRVARVTAPCNAAMARSLDADQGVLDVVVFENANGANTCAVALRPQGLAYIEDVSRRPEQTAQPQLKFPEAHPDLVTRLAQDLAMQGLTLESFTFGTSEARITIRNDRYGAAAQAIGRAARVMTRVVPINGEVFVISVVERGQPVNSVTLVRSDLEELEYDPDNAWAALIRAKIGDHSGVRDAPVEWLYPKFYGSLLPYTETNLFDPDNPLRVDAGIAASGIYELAPGLSFNIHARAKVLGNIDEVKRGSNSVLPRVRTDINRYQTEQQAVRLDRLSADYYFKLNPSTYGRIQAGVLERMYSGVVGEVLWKPTNRNLGLGVEVAYVQQRDFSDPFKLRDYSIVTGHASAYYTFENDMRAQVDVGRYLAGDVGATFSLDRTFRNGWEIGGFFTLTDVSAEDFGEGSFDKGIRMKIPLNWLNGKPSRSRYNLGIQPVQRDGGARLNVAGRLHPIVVPSDRRALIQSWGKFWR